MLQESLGGNSRTALIVCCAPEKDHGQEMISTLRFGERASRIKNKIVRNEELSVSELKEVRQLLPHAKHVISSTNANISSLASLVTAVR